MGGVGARARCVGSKLPLNLTPENHSDVHYHRNFYMSLQPHKWPVKSPSKDYKNSIGNHFEIWHKLGLLWKAYRQTKTVVDAICVDCGSSRYYNSSSEIVLKGMDAERAS